MKIKLLTLLVLLLIFGSCATPHFVPRASDIGTERYGSLMIIKATNGEKIKGEFIAIDEGMFVVLDERKTIFSIPKNEIKKVRIRCARPKQYGWFIPVFIAATLSHGYYLMYSAPINAVVATGVAVSGELDFTYNDKRISEDEIQMFARFPQGIPEGVDLVDIAKAGNIPE